MTLGEKLRKARQEAGLSQELLSEKLHVSRSAVAKWETDKGMPDIENLKAASKLLGVSLDHLLDDGESISFSSIKEAIDIESYQKGGKCRSKYDAAALAKFKNAKQIYPLIRKKKLSKVEHLLEWTVMPAFGMFETVDMINDGCSYYLAVTENKQYMVTVSKEFIEYSELTNKVEGKKFGIGNYVFVKVGYELV